MWRRGFALACLCDKILLPPEWSAGLIHQYSIKIALGSVSLWPDQGWALWHSERGKHQVGTPSYSFHLNMNCHWKLQIWLQCSALQNCTFRQEYVKQSQSLGKEMSPDEVSGFLIPSTSQCLDHSAVSHCCDSSSKCIQTNLQKHCELETKYVAWSKQFWKVSRCFIPPTVTGRLVFVPESKLIGWALQNVQFWTPTSH